MRKFPTLTAALALMPLLSTNAEARGFKEFCAALKKITAAASDRPSFASITAGQAGPSRNSIARRRGALLGHPVGRGDRRRSVCLPDAKDAEGRAARDARNATKAVTACLGGQGVASHGLRERGDSQSDYLTTSNGRAVTA
jgi:hypothetical protein